MGGLGFRGSLTGGRVRVRVRFASSTVARAVGSFVLFGALGACALGWVASPARAEVSRSRAVQARDRVPARVRKRPSYARWLIGAAALTSVEREDFDLVNGDRVQAGEGLLRTSAALQAIANKRVREMAARHSDYAGYDVAVDVRRAKLCTTAEREIEDQLQGGGDGNYGWIELNPRFTAFAVAIDTDASGTYEVEDYQAPCGLAKRKPPAFTRA
jgi:hypothetical protein